MAEIRAIVTVATTANFAGLGAPTLCAPLLYETTTGDLYVLLAPDSVALVGSVAGGSSHTIAQQAFARHVVPASEDLGDAARHLAVRAFDRAPVAQPGVLGDASDIIAARVFAIHDRMMPAITATEVLQERSLRQAQLPAMWR